jgi:hypothetical protein
MEDGFRRPLLLEVPRVQLGVLSMVPLVEAVLVHKGAPFHDGFLLLRGPSLGGISLPKLDVVEANLGRGAPLPLDAKLVVGLLQGSDKLDCAAVGTCRTLLVS